MHRPDATQQLLDARLTDVQWAAVLGFITDHERDMDPAPGASGGVRALRGRLEFIQREARSADPLRA
jgi:hypothetical protein